MHSSLDDILIALITGLIGSGLTLAVERTVKWLHARSIERKFPIAGKYLTRYGDKDKTSSEIVEFRQRGNMVKGESVVNSDNRLNARRWLYEGEVKKEGYLHGSYQPETPFDKGFGAFFLKFGKDGDMQGYWLGKDADESDIQWGEYKFLKQPAFTISPIEPADMIRVLDIAETQLGDAYIVESQLKESSRNVALCARVERTAVAFATARLVDTDWLLSRIQECIEKDSPVLHPLQRRLEGETRIGFVASAATSEKFKGRGLGAELIGRCIESIEERGVNVIVATAWLSRQGLQAGSILECRGFQKLLDLPNYWEKDSLKNGYSCPTCGAPPCHCSAVLYIRNRHAKVRNGKLR